MLRGYVGEDEGVSKDVLPAGRAAGEWRSRVLDGIEICYIDRALLTSMLIITRVTLCPGRFSITPDKQQILGTPSFLPSLNSLWISSVTNSEGKSSEIKLVEDISNGLLV